MKVGMLRSSPGKIHLRLAAEVLGGRQRRQIEQQDDRAIFMQLRRAANSGAPWWKNSPVQEMFLEPRSRQGERTSREVLSSLAQLYGRPAVQPVLVETFPGPPCRDFSLTGNPEIMAKHVPPLPFLHPRSRSRSSCAMRSRSAISPMAPFPRSWTRATDLNPCTAARHAHPEARPRHGVQEMRENRWAT